MDKNTINGFRNELEKLSFKPLMPLTRAKGFIKRIFAKRKGEKNILNQVSGEAETLLKKDPSANTKAFMAERSGQLRRKASEESTEGAKNILESGQNSVKGPGFIAKHKGKILLGGAAAAGLAYANSSNKTDEEKRQQILAQRSMNFPAGMYR